MNTISRYQAGKKNFANLFEAIDYAEKRNLKVIDQVTRMIMWTPK